MAFPLVKAPLGLLQLFRLRTDGRLPDTFSNVVQPVVEVADFYGNKNTSGSAAVVGAITGGGLFSTLLITAPIRVHGASATLIVGAAAATNVGMSTQLIGPSGLGVAVQQMFFPNVNIGAAATCGALCRPFVIPAGWSLLSNVWGTAAGADHSLQHSMLIDIITGVGD